MKNTPLIIYQTMDLSVMSKNKANMSKMSLNKDYIEWLKQLKSKIRSTQIKTAIAVNSTLIDFYFALGKMISEKIVIWGSKLLETLSADLKKEFPDMQGFSVTNLKYCRLFYNYAPIRPQAEDELELERKAINE